MAFFLGMRSGEAASLVGCLLGFVDADPSEDLSSNPAVSRDGLGEMSPADLFT